ncbi:MAG: sigma-70 family RNA polymerase sigma factor [Anaerolineae bacterium]
MQADGDKELFARAKKSDRRALAEIYDRYAGRIYSYVLRRVEGKGLAEDITASVFIKMLDAIEDSNTWKRSFSSWLYRIAHNAVVDHYRRKDKREMLPLNERLVASGDNPVATAENEITMETVRDAMEYLTEAQRSVIELKFFEGFSNLEVANILNKTEGAVKSLQYRALASLRRHLKVGEKDAEKT